jgi:hypothetical protein
MAKYNVTFSCGHTEVVDLVGKNTERERKISYFERSGICSTCYRAQQDAKRAAEIASYNSVNLPALVGTPRQVEWANKIRFEKYQMFAGRGFEFVSSETSAAWWIDHRYTIEDAMRDNSRAQANTKILAMSKSDIFKRAHVLAKNLKVQYPDTDYRANFAECLKALYTAIKSIKASA